MKYDLIRLYKNWIFWAMVICLFASMTICLIVFYKNSTADYEEWGHTVSAYSTEEELDAQIASLTESMEEIREGKQDEFLSALIDEYEEILSEGEETLEILTYLKENHLSYDEISEGTYSFIDSRSRRSLSEVLLEVSMIFLVVCGVFVANILITQPREKGTVGTSLLMKGRTACLKREISSFFVIMTAFAVVQSALICILRLLIPEKTHLLLYYQKGNIVRMTVNHEFILRMISNYLILVPLWMVIVIVSELTRGALSQIVLSGLVMAILLLGFQYLSGKNAFFGSFHTALPLVCADGYTYPKYLLAQVLRYGIVIGLGGWGLRGYSKRRSW